MPTTSAQLRNASAQMAHARVHYTDQQVPVNFAPTRHVYEYSPLVNRHETAIDGCAHVAAIIDTSKS